MGFPAAGGYNINGLQFELPDHLYLIRYNKPDLDFTYKVSIDENDYEEPTWPTISLGPSDWSRTSVGRNHPEQYERFKTARREISGFTEYGSENYIYRFSNNGQIKSLILSIPDGCPKIEASYALLAFDLIASTLHY